MFDKKLKFSYLILMLQGRAVGQICTHEILFIKVNGKIKMGRYCRSSGLNTLA